MTGARLEQGPPDTRSARRPSGPSAARAAAPRTRSRVHLDACWLSDGERAALRAVIEADAVGQLPCLSAGRGSRVGVLDHEGRRFVLKRYEEAPLVLWRTLLRRCRAEREAAALRLVEEATGNPVRVAGWAQDRWLGLTPSCTLITTQLEDSFDLRRLKHLPEGERRARVKELLDVLPARVAELHRAGVWVVTLRGKNVLYRPATREVGLIDLPYARCPVRLTVGHRLYDLGSLFAELERSFSAAELAEFLGRYRAGSPGLSADEVGRLGPAQVKDMTRTLSHQTSSSRLIRELKRGARRSRVGQWLTADRYEQSKVDR